MKLKLLACCFLFAACEAPPEPAPKTLRKIEERTEQIEHTLYRIEWLLQGVETKTCDWPKHSEQLQSNL